MRRAHDEARFSDSAALFDQHAADAPPATRLLRARIYLKTQNAPQAIVFLTSIPSKLTKSLEAERLMLLGVAHARVGRFDDADSFFDQAVKAGAVELFPVELPYLKGRRFLEERRSKEARAQLSAVRIFKTADARVWGDLLESGILSTEESYGSEAQVLLGLIKFIDGAQSGWLEESIHAIRTLSMLARELDDPALSEFVKNRVGRQQWSDDFRAHQFQTVKAVGWCCALQGDYFNGLRYLKMAGGFAPSAAWRAMTLLDRAYLARCFGERHWSRDELAEADDLMASVQWRETKDEERVALLLAAELHAPVDSGKAAGYLGEFSEMRDALSPLVLFRYDRRLSALADYASGIVQVNFGNHKAAVKSLTRAWEVYDKIGYDWRAGRSSLRLYELTGDQAWLQRARTKLKNYRTSWLWKELQEIDPARDDMPRLTPAQRRILHLLYSGKTTKEICVETDCSAFTIQNHIKAILKAFGLPNRATLVAELVKRGITLT